MSKFDQIDKNNSKETKKDSSQELNLDSLMNLASKLTKEDALFNNLLKNDAADDLDLSGIFGDITGAASDTFEGVKKELVEIKMELVKLNTNIEALLKKS
ncbi:hypothetical protein [Halobacillus sp. BAB-2008]|uniref:hypothetical protein n=1 Tax=Halobacillus sp. BAB-2008 TaxID=1246484 RepID=UPI0002A52403|nr:hypothetical protein [Halobacillus sp. BAB-2008]ELK48527.1 hypothetical protein D479_02887 [Halobacillus sp. BAB-2008]